MDTDTYNCINTDTYTDIHPILVAARVLTLTHLAKDPPRPAVNVDVGAPSVAPSAHADRASASGEVDVVDDGTHAAGSIAAAYWFAATLGGGDVAEGGAGAVNSTYDDAQSDDDDDEPAHVHAGCTNVHVDSGARGCGARGGALR